MHPRNIGNKLIGMVLVLGLAVPLAGQVITPDQQKRLYDYFNLNEKFHTVGKGVVEGMMTDAPEFFGKYADALAVVNICNKFANAEDMEAFKGVIDIAESKLIEAIYKPYATALGWVSWAKTGMELLNDFVVTPARMDFAMDGYYRSRAAGTEPEDALTVMRDWGQVQMEMKKAMREQYGDQIFSEIKPSGLTLLPAWQKKLDGFTRGWFEAQYAARVQREAAEAFARTLNKTLEQLAGYDAQMLLMLKEAEEQKPVRIYARPAQQTIKVGGMATFEIVGVLKNGNEEVLGSNSFGGEGEYDKPGMVSVELTAGGLSTSAVIIIVRDETPVSLDFSPPSAEVMVGEKAEFRLRATFPDKKREVVGVQVASFDKPGTYPISGEFGGLTATATLVVARKEKPLALFARPESVSIKVGETATIFGLARYEDGAEETVVLQTVTGRTVGTRRVDFSFQGLSASATVVTTRDEKPVSLDFSPASAELLAGQKMEFRLRATFPDGKREVVGVQVASYDKPGTYTISGEFGGLTATATLVVTRNEKPAALFAKPESVTIKVGETATITGVARFTDGAEEVVYVKAVQGRQVGSSRIEVYFQGLSAYATVVTVRDEKPVALKFSPETRTVPPGEKAEFSLRATFEDGKIELVGIQIVSQDRPGTYPVTGEFGGLTAAASLIVLSEEKPLALAFVPPVVKVKVGEGGSYQVMAKYPGNREQVVGGKTFPAYDKPGLHRVNFEFMGLTAEGTILVLALERKTSGLRFTPPDPTLTVGQAITLTLRASFQDGETTVTEPVDAVPISYDKVGTYTVTRSYGGLTATATITVIKEEKPTQVLVVPPTQTVEIGQKAVYAVVAVYESGERVIIRTDSFSATDKPGTYPIQGSFYGVAFSGSVTVVETRAIESVFLRPESQEVKLGGSASFELVIKYTDGGLAILKQQTFEGKKVGTQSVFMEAEGKSAGGWLVVLPLDVEKEDEKEKEKDKEKEEKKEKDVKGDDDPCASANVLAGIEKLNSLVNNIKACRGRVDQYYSRFTQAVASMGNQKICNNFKIAYCYANALSNAVRIVDYLLEAEDIAAEILMLYGICPDLATTMKAQGHDIASIIAVLGSVKGAGEAGTQKVNAMLGLLNAGGCDISEIIRSGENNVRPDQDPDNIVLLDGTPAPVCYDWWLSGGGTTQSKQNWSLNGRAEGLSDFDLNLLKFTGQKQGLVSLPDGARGTFAYTGNNIRFLVKRTVFENGKSVNLTYTFIGSDSGQSLLIGTYTVEGSDGRKQRGNWRADKK